MLFFLVLVSTINRDMQKMLCSKGSGYGSYRNSDNICGNPVTYDQQRARTSAGNTKRQNNDEEHFILKILKEIHIAEPGIELITLWLVANNVIPGPCGQITSCLFYLTIFPRNILV